MKAICFVLTLLLLTNCNNKVVFSDIRNEIENTDHLVVNYRFCMYEENYKRMEMIMYEYVKSTNQKKLCTYFNSKGIKSKKVMAKVLVRNLCRVREYFGRPLNKLQDKPMRLTLEQCIKETTREVNGITSYYGR